MEAAAVASPRVAVSRKSQRIDAIDVLRGAVMIVMVLDHTRDYVHADATRFDPLDLQFTTPALFVTRWITHFCAPMFVLLAGAGARLQAARTPTPVLAAFLFSRGAWLVVLEFTVIRITTWFNFDYSFLALLQVIWAIGISMMVLAGLVYLPLRAIAAIAVGMIALHNAADGVHVQGWQGPGTPVPGALATIWILAHQSGEALPVFGSPGPFVFVMYPLIPWIGVLAAGYVLGGVYEWTMERRTRTLERLGFACMGGFAILRATNLYGDASHWAWQNTGLLTLMSFVNTTKYPPSLLFLLMTLGPGIVALAWLERLRSTSVPDGTGFVPSGTEVGWLRRTLTTLGRVPLFFYLLQWPIAHAIAVFASMLAGKPTAHLFANPPEAMTNAPAGAGFPLPMVYVCWLIGVLILLPLCRWYADVKRQRPNSWLRYL